MLITMSRKGNLLCQVCRIKNRYKLLDLRVIRIIKVKIEITSDNNKKVVGSSGGERQEGIELSKKERTEQTCEISCWQEEDGIH